MFAGGGQRAALSVDVPAANNAAALAIRTIRVAREPDRRTAGRGSGLGAPAPLCSPSMRVLTAYRRPRTVETGGAPETFELPHGPSAAR